MKNNKSSLTKFLTLSLGLAVAGLSPSAHAANDLWVGNGPDANFSTLSNWTGSVNPNGNTPQFGAAGSSGTTLNNDQTGSSFAGLLFNSGASAFTIGGNSFTLTGNITNNGANTQTINNAITLNNAAHTFAATSGDIALGGNFSGATTQSATFTGSGTTTLGGTNAFNMNGGGGNSFYTFSVGSGNGASPTSGNLSITGATTVDGSTGTGTQYWGYLSVIGNSNLTIQSSGSLAINTSLPTANNLASAIGQNATGTSTLTVNGSFSLNGNGGLLVGNNRSDATGVLTINSGGTATLTAGSTTLQDNRNTIILGNAGATGIINLNGGTLATGRQFVRGSGAGTATFNFNGGVLQAQANQTQGNGWFETATSGNFQVVTTTVKVGGAKIDTNTFNTNINTVLAHDSGLGATADGGLTKSGLGTLTLGAANTYTGTTTVQNGTLAVGLSGSISGTLVLGQSGVSTGTLDVTAKAAFSEANISGNGTINIGAGKTVTATGNVAPGFSPGTINVTGNFTLASTAATTMEVASTSSYDMLNASGTFTYGGTLNVTSYGGYDLSQAATYGLFTSNSGTNTGFASDFSGVTVNGVTLADSSGIWTGMDGSANYTFTDATGTLAVTTIPEPSTWASLLGGLGALIVVQRGRRRRSLI